MRVRVLHAKLYAYALPGSTARQLFISSTLLDSSTARQLLDRPRQTSTALDAQPHGVRKSQARQELDSNSTGSTGKASTAPRQRLDSASPEPRTARQLDSQGSKPGKTPFISILFCTRLELSALQHTTRKSHDFEVRTGKAKGVTVSLIPRRGIYVSRIDSPGCMWLAADLCSGLSC